MRGGRVEEGRKAGRGKESGGGLKRERRGKEARKEKGELVE